MRTVSSVTAKIEVTDNKIINKLYIRYVCYSHFYQPKVENWEGPKRPNKLGWSEYIGNLFAMDELLLTNVTSNLLDIYP